MLIIFNDGVLSLFPGLFFSSTVNSIMNHPKCGPKSNLAHNTSAYLKFGLPRVVARSGREESSGYDSSNDGSPVMRSKNLLSRSDPDFRKNLIQNPSGINDVQQKSSSRERRMKSISEANLLSGNSIFCYNIGYCLKTAKYGNQVEQFRFVNFDRGLKFTTAVLR